MKPRLVAISGPLKGSVFPITDAALTVGRAEENAVRLDDDLVSRRHFSAWLKDGKPYLKDVDTPNGTFVNGRAFIERFLDEGDRIVCGSTTFIYMEAEEDPEDLLQLIQEDEELRRQIPTLRADYSVREEAGVYYRTLFKSSIQMAESLNALEDPALLRKRLLDLTLEILPALRGAILLNGRRVSPDPDEFALKTFLERDYDRDSPFPLSTKILQEVYASAAPHLSNDLQPVMCAPLIVSGAICGVLYVEGASRRNGFEPEHLVILKGIAQFAITAARLAKRFESITDARDLLKEEHPVSSEIVGQSDPMQGVCVQIDKAAQYPANVLILGETGTGKEIIARNIHARSARRDEPYVAINCAAIPESLLESELYGHAKGGFTGATAARKGKFRMANGGTIFLDEIGRMSYDAQTRLLRVLQERKVSPVGSDEEFEVDVRVLAATNVNLEEAIREKRFLEDLFYRLNVMRIEVPPLRERVEDIPLLAAHFLTKYREWRDVKEISTEAIKALMAHSWPGNVRELENAIQVAIMNCRDGIIEPDDLPKSIFMPKALAAAADLKGKGRAASRSVKKADILARMKATGENAEQAGAHFGLSRSWTYELLKEDE